MILGLSLTARAQFDVSTRNGQTPKEPVPQNVREQLEQRKIDERKRDYQELIDRGEEAVKISKEIEASFSKHQKLTSNNLNRLKNLEKLLKKIRKDLGGDDDDENESIQRPESTLDTLILIRETSVRLCEELKTITRFSISAAAIEDSNNILKLIRFVRG